MEAGDVAALVVLSSLAVIFLVVMVSGVITGDDWMTLVGAIVSMFLVASLAHLIIAILRHRRM